MDTLQTGKALFKSVLEEPEEDLHRLAYADWLEEQGDSDRAEFIRLQLKVAKPDPGARVSELIRCENLINRHGREWGRPVRDLLTQTGPASWQWRRGFLEVFWLHWADWKEKHLALRKITPVREVNLLDRPNLIIQPSRGEYQHIFLSGFTNRLIIPSGDTPTQNLTIRLLNLEWPGIEFRILQQPPT